MSNGFRVPPVKFRYFDANGYPLAAGKVYTYGAGSTTPATTFADWELTAQNTNPVVLDVAGEANIFVPLAVGFKFVITDANEAVLDTQDNMYGSITTADVLLLTNNAISASGITSIWTPSTNPPVYVSASSFTLPGNETAGFAVGNRVRFNLVNTTGFGTITASAYSSPNTTVTIDVDGDGLDNTLEQVYYSNLTASGRGIDAGAVDYSSTLAYSVTGTVGNKLRSLDEALAATQVTLGSSLPGSSTEGKIFLNTTDGRLNIWHSGGWVQGANAPDIAGLTAADTAETSARTTLAGVVTAYNATAHQWNALQQFASTGAVGLNSQPGWLQVWNAPGSGAATMSFHRQGVYAVNFGLDTDNYIRLGGWSDGTNTYRLSIGPGGDFATRGAITSGGSIGVTGTLTTSGGITAGGNVGVTGTITSSGGITASGSVSSVGVTSSGNVSVTGTITASSTMSAGGSPVVTTGTFTGNQDTNSNGYQKYPGSIIEQWCEVGVVGSGNTSVTFTYPFASMATTHIPRVSIYDPTQPNGGNYSNFVSASVTSFSTTGCVVGCGLNGGSSRDYIVCVDVRGTY